MKIGIVGLGLIGSSIGLSLQNSDKYQVFGYDVSQKNIDIAIKRSVIDCQFEDLSEMAACDLVFISVPPASVVAVLSVLELSPGRRCIATDCTSVKGLVVDWINQTNERSTWVVGGHPLAGNEGQGPEAASDELFSQSGWVLTPCAGTMPEIIDCVSSVVKDIGAVPVLIDPREHDSTVALTSHLPHILANIVVQRAISEGIPRIYGGSWKDLTRVSGSNPALWQQIFRLNRLEIINVVSRLQEDLSSFVDLLNTNDSEALFEFNESAAIAKKQLGGDTW